MSKRFYITLNPNKEKDLVILEYLNSTYNESETIKSILYKIAINRSSEVNFEKIVQRDITITEELKGTNKLNEEQGFKNNKNIENNLEVDEDIKSLFA
ncbi:hypothetical protein [Clostridium disporicum]|uniref:hypothetical protein n=1 Tax=Clostridium disporicum TaxID=84024 RepID=UPI003613082B